jgi:2-polyprenyl-3-methyl-5-hydroxy-6-metoxy-1,4-benzoquinol methylase
MQRYWNDIIRDWEDTSYSKSSDASFIERLAGKFRGHIVDRHHTCVNDVKKFVGGMTVMEIGCASGNMCFELLQNGASKAIGLDIADSAVNAAKAKAAKLGVPEGKASFFRYTIGEQLPVKEKVDLVVGLGITEYVQPSDLKKFLQEVNPKYVFISFDEKVVNMQKIIHFGYRTFKQIPYYKMYSQPEMKELVESAGFSSVRTYRDKANAFVTNLPV